eukprot:2151583-Pyramimonas_sp.AAC.1
MSEDGVREVYAHSLQRLALRLVDAVMAKAGRTGNWMGARENHRYVVAVARLERDPRDDGILTGAGSGEDLRLDGARREAHNH